MTDAPASTRLASAYEPSAVEDRIYAFWEEGGYFRAQVVPGEAPYSIVMPPPNVTGELHLGHGLEDALTDTLVRWHRMQGEPTLWLPGEDHAGIATQNVMERELLKEGLTRHDLGREAFEERVSGSGCGSCARASTSSTASSARAPTGAATPSRLTHTSCGRCGPPSSTCTGTASSTAGCG